MTPVPAATPSRARGLLLALLLYTAALGIFFHHALPRLDDYLIGPPEDNIQFYWNLWYAQGVVDGHYPSLLATDMIYYPDGNMLVFNDMSCYNVAVLLLLRRFVSLTTAYNLIVFHALVLAGLGAYLLIRYLTGQHGGALLGGFIYAFNPAAIGSALHHLDLVSMQFIPFFIWFFIRCVRTGSRRDLALAATFFLAASLCTWFYFIFLLLFLGLAYGYLAWRRRRWLLPGLLARIAVIAGVTMIILSPWLVRLVALSLEKTGTYRPAHGLMVVDLAGLVLPHYHHWLTESWAWLGQVNARYTGNHWETMAYLGLANLALILLSGVWRRPENRKYMLGFAVFTLLALGAQLHLAGAVLPVPLPAAVLEHLPVLKNLRAPGRFRPFMYLFLAIMVAQAVGELWRRRNRWSRPLVVALVVLSVADFSSGRDELTPVAPLPVYAMLPPSPARFGVLDLPAGEYGFAMQAMLYQTFHKLPIVQGCNTRKFSGVLMDELELADLARQRRQLTEHTVRYIVIHKEWLAGQYPRRLPLDLARYRAEYPVVYEDDAAIALQVY